MQLRLRDLSREMDRCGLIIRSASQRKHYKLIVALKDRPEGPTRIYVAPVSPSCRRGEMNRKSQLRRLAAEMKEARS